MLECITTECININLLTLKTLNIMPKEKLICGSCLRFITESYVIAISQYDNSKYNKCFDCIAEEEMRDVPDFDDE
jgi:uncharacterized CHY-type Zn-finger protein